MNLKRVVVIALFSVLLALVWIELFLIVKESHQLSASYEKLSEEISLLDEENKKIEKDIAFYSIPENLSKNLDLLILLRSP